MIVIVTGTDTGVGKTVVTAALTTILRAPYVLKPVQTGVGPDEPGDLDEVRRLAGDVPGHEGIRLRAPLAPESAARLEGVQLPDIDQHLDRIMGLVPQHNVIVEGAGGVMVRLGAGWGLLDLAVALQERGARVRFVVVARAGLGTLNHAALTVQAIHHAGVPFLGAVIGSWPVEPDLAARENLGDLPHYVDDELMGRVPEGAGAWSREAFVAAAPGWIRLPPP